MADSTDVVADFVLVYHYGLVRMDKGKDALTGFQWLLLEWQQIVYPTLVYTIAIHRALDTDWCLR